MSTDDKTIIHLTKVEIEFFQKLERRILITQVQHEEVLKTMKNEIPQYLALIVSQHECDIKQNWKLSDDGTKLVKE